MKKEIDLKGLGFCVFDVDTKRCPRCGYTATKLPTYRVCRNLHELSAKIAVDTATKRIRVRPLQVGDAVAYGFKKVGITPERIKKLTGVKECGCAKRQSQLNALSEAVSKVIENVANAALNFALPQPVDPDDIAAVARSVYANPLTNQGLKDRAAGR